MPTGYTAPIEYDDGYTFEQFVWRCARAFGACVLMRDDGMDKRIPEKFEPSDFYANLLKERQAKLAELRGMTLEQAAVLRDAEFKASVKSAMDHANRNTERLARYNAIREKVQGWVPPEALRPLQAFMMQQIAVSSKHLSTDWEQPELLDPDKWLARAIESAERDIEHYAEEAQEEIRRTEERNEWLRALRESVPQPEGNV